MKKKISITLISLFIISPFSFVHSEEKINSQNYNYFGLSASSISGTGLSYGRIFGSDYLLKICGMYYNNREKKTSETDPSLSDFNTTKWWDSGAELQRIIYSKENENAVMHFYGLIGGSYWYEKKERPFSPEKNRTVKYYSAGAGFGVRIKISDRFAINGDIGYQYSGSISNSEKYTGLGGGVGVNFLF